MLCVCVCGSKICLPNEECKCGKIAGLWRSARTAIFPIAVSPGVPMLSWHPDLLSQFPPSAAAWIAMSDA